MEIVKETKEYKIIKKRSGRFAVQNLQKTGKRWINSDEKVKILLEAGLIKITLPKEKPAEEEAPAEEAAS